MANEQQQPDDPRQRVVRFDFLAMMRLSRAIHKIVLLYDAMLAEHPDAEKWAVRDEATGELVACSVSAAYLKELKDATEHVAQKEVAESRIVTP